MKVMVEDKRMLRDFWGSHGDKKDYKINITGLTNMKKDVRAYGYY